MLSEEWQDRKKKQISQLKADKYLTGTQGHKGEIEADVGIDELGRKLEQIII